MHAGPRLDHKLGQRRAAALLQQARLFLPNSVGLAAFRPAEARRIPLGSPSFGIKPVDLQCQLPRLSLGGPTGTSFLLRLGQRRLLLPDLLGQPLTVYHLTPPCVLSMHGIGTLTLPVFAGTLLADEFARFLLAFARSKIGLALPRFLSPCSHAGIVGLSLGLKLDGSPLSGIQVRATAFGLLSALCIVALHTESNAPTSASPLRHLPVRS